jgi:formyltetrahydrofolate deformylase
MSSAPDDRPELVLTLACPDGPGIVFAVSGFLAERGCNIEQSQQYGDPQTGTFFMRVQFGPVDGQPEPAFLARMQAEFTTVAHRHQMSWRMVDARVPQRVLVMVSTAGHCLNDLLFREQIGALPVDVVAVLSNHVQLRWLADSYQVPFHHVPVDDGVKAAAEAELLRLVEQYRVDLVVLARYMQVLSPHLCAALAGRMINIHHSMLPSFRGGRPYQQAYDRGVKLIGATAHYVTADLDEGPIIEQEVARIDHGMTAAEVAGHGRDVERLALARAVQWHAENRVLLNGSRTVVFR